MKRSIFRKITHKLGIFEDKVPICILKENDKLLEGKVALITGGTGGIGIAIAKTFLESGCKVIISGTSEEKLMNYSKELGSNCQYLKIDLNNVKEFKDKVIEASRIFGTIDILVNSAGIHTVRPNFDFFTITEEEYDSVMNLNLKGTYFLSQEIGNYMIENNIKGHILMISSQSALEPSWSPYRLSKCGIDGITKGIAQRLLSYGIIVNGIGPGPTATAMQSYVDGDNIYTDLNPIKRYTMPMEVAMYARMLVSDLGNTIVGDTLYMSGGRGIVEIR